jgi:hypothetical protein
MTREEQIIKASQLYAKHQQKPFMDGARWADEHPSNLYKDVIAHISGNAYKVWKQNLWHDAQGDDLPAIDKEVIVLCNNGKVCYGHRPKEYWDGKNIATGEVTRHYPKRYDKGGWNIPDVKWWLNVELPNMEEEK